MALRTDFKNAEYDGMRKYRMINNADGTISLQDVTDYRVVGSTFGGGEINATNSEVNALYNNVNNIYPAGTVRKIINNGICNEPINTVLSYIIASRLYDVNMKNDISITMRNMPNITSSSLTTLAGISSRIYSLKGVNKIKINTATTIDSSQFESRLYLYANTVDNTSQITYQVINNATNTLTIQLTKEIESIDVCINLYLKNATVTDIKTITSAVTLLEVTYGNIPTT